MGAPVDPSDAVYFPYAVVEIKMQAEPPEWVQGHRCRQWHCYGTGPPTEDDGGVWGAASGAVAACVIA
jgi:hypothetical protein